MKCHRVLFLWLCTLCFVNSDFLNDYLLEKRFGPIPGPCPDRERACTAEIDAERMNPATANIRICIIRVTIIFWTVEICDTIANFFSEGGPVTVWNIECENIGLDSVAVSTVSSSASQAVSRFTGDAIRTQCTGDMYLDKFSISSGVLTFKITGDTRFSTVPSETSSFDFQASFSADPSFEETVPTDVVIPPEDCNIFIGSGFSMDLEDNRWDEVDICIDGSCIFDIGAFDLEALSNVVAGGVESAFGGILCNLLSQGAKVDPENPDTSADGELNFLLDDFGDFILDIASGQPDDALALDENPVAFEGFQNTLTQEEVDLGVDFASNNIVEIVSVALNNWLGRPGADGRPAINEAVEGLLGPNGDFEFDLFDGEGDDILLNGTLQANLFDIFLGLRKISFNGLNNIDTFQVAGNNFEEGTTEEDRLHYTLNHSISLSELEFALTLQVEFQRGKWVTQSECGNIVPCKPRDEVTLRENEGHPDLCECPAGITDRESFEFDLQMALNDVNIDMTSFSIFDPDQVSEVQLGQLFGRDFSSDPLGAVRSIMECLAPGLYGAWIPSLSLSVGDINSPPTIDIEENTGLASLVENSVTFVDVLFNSVFRDAAPGITQGEVRPEINEFLLFDVVSIETLENCEPYVPGNIAEEDAYFKFSSGLLNNIFPVINDVLGDFSRETNTDINDLVQVLLEYFSETYDDFPIQAISEADGGEQGDWEMKPDSKTLIYIPGFEDTPENERFFNFSTVIIEQLNSIYEVASNELEGSDYGIVIDLGFGHYLPQDIDAPLDISFNMQVKIDDAETTHGSGVFVPIDEVVTIRTSLDEIDLAFTLDNLKINRDLLYQLRFDQLDYIPCLFSVLDEPMQAVDSTLLAESVFVDFDTKYDPGSQPAGLHPYVESLIDLEAATNEGASNRFRAMVNTILNNGFARVLESIEDFDVSYTPDNCLEAEDPFGSFLSFFTGIDLPEFAEQIEECIQPPTETPLLPFEAEAQVKGLLANTTYFDFTQSQVIDFLQGELGTNTDDANRNQVLSDILFLLANQSGTPITDSFFDETFDGEEVVSLYLDLAGNNWIFDLFGIDPLIFIDDSLVPGFHLEVQNLTVRGINRFVASTSFLQTISRFITGYTLGFSPENPLDIYLSGFFETDNSFIGVDTPGTVRETFQIETQIQGFELDFELLMAINTGIFGNLTLGHFFDINAEQDFGLSGDSQECLLSAIFEDGLNIPRLNMSLTNLVGPTLTTSGNFFSPEVEAVMDQTLKMFTQMYIDSIPNVAFNCLRGSVNDVFQNSWDDAQNGSCPDDPTNTPLGPEDEILRFGDSEGLRRFQNFLDDNLRANDNELFNQVMRTLTRDDNNQAVVLFDDDPFGVERLQLNYKGTNYGFLTMEISDLAIDGLDSFSDFQIVTPTGDDQFTTRTGFHLTGPSEFDFKYQTIAYDTFKEDDEMQNDLSMVVTVSELDVYLQARMRINITEALNIRFSSISSLNELPCLLVPFDELTINAFNLTVDDINVRLGCFGQCEFPLFSGSLEDGAEIDSSENADISTLLNELIQFASDFVEGSGAQSLIDTQIETADETCAEILGLLTNFLSVEEEEDLDAATFMIYAFGGLVGIGGLGLGFLMPLHKRRQSTMIKEFATERKTMEKEKEVQLFKLSLASLMAHPVVPRPMAIIVPIVAIVHVFSLVIAVAFSDAMHIIIVFEVFGADTQDIILVPFTIMSTINDMWNAGSWYLAVITFVASVAWPIFKNLAMLVIWFLPTTILSAPKRESYLTIMDAFGKWSFLDVFIVVMTLASLRTYLRLSAYSRLEFLSENTFNVDVNVTPERGIILLFGIATTSLILNHVLSHYANKIKLADQKKEDELRGILVSVPPRAAAKKAISNHLFAGFDRSGRRKVVSRKSSRLLNIVNILSGFLVMIGVFLPLVTFEMGGIVGLLIGEVDDPLTTKTYSVFNLATIAGEVPRNDFGSELVAIYFQLMLIAVSLIFPLVLTVLNWFLLTRKMSLDAQANTLRYAYMAYFWSAIEGFLIAVALSVAEIDRIAVYIVDFISDDLCSNFKTLLETLVGPQDGTCLEVGAGYELTGAIILLGVILQLGSTLFTLKIAEAAIADRYFQSYNGVRAKTTPPKMGRVTRQVVKMMTDKVIVQPKNGVVVKDDDGMSGFSALDSLPPRPKSPVAEAPRPVVNYSSMTRANPAVTEFPTPYSDQEPRHTDARAVLSNLAISNPMLAQLSRGGTHDEEESEIRDEDF